MFLKQYYLGCLAHASYLIADEKNKIAAVVDPQRDIEQYLADAASHGFTIKHVYLTHFHADFLAGHIELRNRTGARIYLGARAEAEFDFQKCHTGDSIEFGDVRLDVLETPGHTPEGISILVYDLAKNAEKPHAVLTGDTLFIGDVGRPDLLASIGVTADELAEMLYRSLGELRKLPDETLVYPAHGAGSLCGKNLSDETVSTIGEQKKYNYALQPMKYEDFKAIVTADQPEAPEYFVYDAIRNRQERPDLDVALKKSMKGLSVDEVIKLRDNGAQIVDVREGIDYEGAHLVGSMNISLKGKYATWCGTLLDHEKPIVVIAEQGNEEEAVVRLGRIGFDNVAGYLANGMQSLDHRPEFVKTVSRITAPALADLRRDDPQAVIVDVRTENEWKAGHIEGSVNVPLAHLRERIDELPTNDHVVVHCEGGYRSAIAASLLSQAGRRNVLDLVGGYKAWQASKLPTTSDGVPANA